MTEISSQGKRIIEIVAGRDVGHSAGPFPEKTLPGPDDYVTYFCNSVGDELVFVQRPGELTASLFHSETDWIPTTICAGEPEGVMLDPPEWLWLKASWDASASYRGAPAC